MKIPDKWYIKRNKETMGEVNKYFSHLFNMTFTTDGSWYDALGETGKRGYVNHDYLHFPKYDKRVRAFLPQPGYTEISFEDFKNYILNNKQKQTDMSESLIGRKVRINPNAKLKASNYIGQICEITSEGPNTVYVEASDGDHFHLGKPNHDMYPNEFTLVDENEGKNIVAYTLVKDLPGVKAGARFIKDINDDKYWKEELDRGADFYFFNNTDVSDTEWFSPVYEEEKFIIDDYEANFEANDHVSFGCKSFSIDDLISYRRLLKTTDSKITVRNTEITKELLDKLIKKIESKNVQSNNKAV